MLFKSFALASLASFALAGNYTFNVVGDNINSPLNSIGGQLVSSGVAGQFVFDEGYLENFEGKYLSLNDAIVLFTDKGSASKFQLEDNKLSSLNGITYYASPTGQIFDVKQDGLTEVQIKVVTALDTPGTHPAPSVSSTINLGLPQFTSYPDSQNGTAIPAPTNYGNATIVTKVSSTLVTITSCPETVTDCPLRSSWSAVTWVETYTYPAGAPPAGTGVQVQTVSPPGGVVVTESFVGAGIKQAAGVGAVVAAAAALLA